MADESSPASHGPYSLTLVSPEEDEGLPPVIPLHSLPLTLGRDPSMPPGEGVSRLDDMGRGGDGGGSGHGVGASSSSSHHARICADRGGSAAAAPAARTCISIPVSRDASHAGGGAAASATQTEVDRAAPEPHFNLVPIAPGLELVLRAKHARVHAPSAQQQGCDGSTGEAVKPVACLISDLDSISGVFINSVRVMPGHPWPLREGDVISLGYPGPVALSVPVERHSAAPSTHAHANITTTMRQLCVSYAVKRRVKPANPPATEGAMAVESSSPCTAMVPAASSSVDADALTRMSVPVEDLTCGICWETLATAAHLSCGHVICFTCAHQSFTSQSFLYGYAGVRRDCPLDRKRIRSVTRDLMLDRLAVSLVERGGGGLNTDAERAEWKERAEDGLKLARYYEETLRSCPDGLPPRERLEEGVVVVLRYVNAGSREEESKEEGWTCQGCGRQLAAADEALKVLRVDHQGGSQWSMASLYMVVRSALLPSGAAGHGNHHLACLKPALLRAAAASRKPEAFMRLTYRVLAGGEAVVRGHLAKDRVTYPWWLVGPTLHFSDQGSDGRWPGDRPPLSSRYGSSASSAFPSSRNRTLPRSTSFWEDYERGLLDDVDAYEPTGRPTLPTDEELLLSEVEADDLWDIGMLQRDPATWERLFPLEYPAPIGAPPRDDDTGLSFRRLPASTTGTDPSPLPPPTDPEASAAASGVAGGRDGGMGSGSGTGGAGGTRSMFGRVAELASSFIRSRPRTAASLPAATDNSRSDAARGGVRDDDDAMPPWMRRHPSIASSAPRFTADHLLLPGPTGNNTTLRSRSRHMSRPWSATRRWSPTRRSPSDERRRRSPSGTSTSSSSGSDRSLSPRRYRPRRRTYSPLPYTRTRSHTRPYAHTRDTSMSAHAHHTHRNRGGARRWGRSRSVSPPGRTDRLRPRLRDVRFTFDDERARSRSRSPPVPSFDRRSTRRRRSPSPETRRLRRTPVLRELPAINPFDFTARDPHPFLSRRGGNGRGAGAAAGFAGGASGARGSGDGGRGDRASSSMRAWSPTRGRSRSRSDSRRRRSRSRSRSRATGRTRSPTPTYRPSTPSYPLRSPTYSASSRSQSPTWSPGYSPGSARSSPRHRPDTPHSPHSSVNYADW